MAERRMFSKAIIDSDAFLDMSTSAQSLYFHLSMRADDEGFVNNPKKIQRMVGSADDDIKILIAKRFVLVFESGVIVIKHWKIHNYIQKDRFKPTLYQKEKSLLSVKPNSSYTEKPIVYNLDTECVQDGYNMDAQVRLGKVSQGKVSVEDEADKPPPKALKRFIPPTLGEVKAYCKERKNRVNAEKFFAHYESNGWMTGRVPMKSWKHAVIKWELSDFDRPKESDVEVNWAT